MKYTLIVNTRRNLYKFFQFDSMKDAYKYYLRHYSTVGEWIYYFRFTGCFLFEEKSEWAMELIFDTVFRRGRVTLNKG